MFHEPAAEATVSVVIPTVNRPALLRRAVESALSQKCPPYEVIVVQDGSGGEALDKVREIEDDRLVLLQTGSPSGDAGATARNVGVRAARGEWIAFLDDDDEWLPEKLELQLAAARGLGDGIPVVVSGKVERRRSDASSVWPLRAKRPDERISDYLFVRRFEGEGWLPTPTLLTQRSVASRHLFQQGLRQHEDYDWMLRLEAAGVRFVVLDDVIAIVHVVDPNSSSSTAAWQDSLAWANERKALLGPRAYSAFCLTEVSRTARRSGSFRGFVRILASSLRGRPRPRDLLQFAGTWLLSPQTKERLARTRRARAVRSVSG